MDDEPQLAALGRRQLKRLGIEVSAHSSSLQALEDFVASPHASDIVISDDMMPHMSGLELVKALKALRPELPVLMVTGYGSDLSSEVLASHGVNRVLLKPFEAAELKSALSELLRQEF